MSENSLSHYGVKGMKWGVRRTDAQLKKSAERASKGKSTRTADRKAKRFEKRAAKAEAKTKGTSSELVGKKPTGRQIKDARKRHNARVDRIAAEVQSGIASGDAAAQRKASANIRKIAKEAGASKDASIGAKLTRGERVAAYAFLGPLAIVANSSAQNNRTAIAENYIKTAQNTKVADFYDYKKDS